MDEKPLSEKLQNAPSDTLKEILRQAEAHLDAQLTAAIAADQRAYTFAGLASASAVLLLGGTYSVITASHPDVFIGLTAFFVAVGLFAASWMAVSSARSVDFSFTGSRPGTWTSDIENKAPLEQSLAEQCGNYDDAINANRRTMESNSWVFNWATNVALSSVGLGAIALLFWMGTVLGIG